MPNSKLTSYIREQIRAGYDINLVRNYLIKYGYSYKDVDEAINEIYHPGVQHHVHHLSKNTIIAMAVIGLLIVLLIPTVYFFISERSTTARLLDLSTTALQSSVKPGDKLGFNIEISNEGRSKRYDVSLRHEIVGTEIFKEETVAVETSTSKTSYIQLPDDIQPRKYTLKTTATYDNKKAFSTFGFSVLSSVVVQTECIEDWSCGEWQPAECPASGRRTRACIESNNCRTSKDKPEITQDCVPALQENIAIQTTGSDLTVWQKLEQIKETAKTNPVGAEIECEKFDIDTHKDECYNTIAQSTLSADRCEKVTGERTKDNCYSDIASATDSSMLCEEIVKTTRKDSCYMNFVNKKDYTVCDRIDNSYLKEACNALKDMPDIVVS